MWASNTNNSSIHPTSAFHIWFTFKHRLVMIICFHSFLSLFVLFGIIFSPFSSFVAYTYFYLIKDFVRFYPPYLSPTFSRVFLYNTLLYYNVDTQLKDRRSSLSMQWRHNILCRLSFCVGCYIITIIIICEGKKVIFFQRDDFDLFVT